MARPVSPSDRPPDPGRSCAAASASHCPLPQLRYLPKLRMNEAPAIEVHIIQNSEPPGGMGEAGTSAVAPAVTNAIFAATGKRLRNLPIDTTALKQRA